MGSLLYSNFPLSIHLTHDNVYMSMLLSPFALPFLYIWNLERWYWWTHLQGRTGDIDVENRLMYTAGEGEGGISLNFLKIRNVYWILTFIILIFAFFHRKTDFSQSELYNVVNIELYLHSDISSFAFIIIIHLLIFKCIWLHYYFAIHWNFLAIILFRILALTFTCEIGVHLSKLSSS